MLYTVEQAKNGIKTGIGGSSSIQIEDLALKEDVPSKEEFEELEKAVGEKLDRSPMHTHDMSQIEQLTNTLSTKLDSNKKYNYSSIISNPEDIDYLTTVQTTKMEIVPAQNDTKGYKFNIDSVGDFQIIYNNQVINNYDVLNKKWIMNGIDIVDVLENHTVAINQALDGKVSGDTVDESTVKTLLSTKADVSHTHTTKDITDLSTSIDSKIDTKIKTQIASKANAEHQHTLEDIIDYKDYDDSKLKAIINTKAEAKHTHSVADIIDYIEYDDTQVRALINAKADNTHTHTTEDIIDYEAYDDTEVKAELANKAEATHKHEITDVVNGEKTLLSTIVDLVYPVGAIYITTDSLNTPTKLFPGTTWTQITNRFLWCSTSANSTGGSTKITVDNLPAHDHGFNGGYTWRWGQTTDEEYQVYCPTAAAAGESDGNYIHTNVNTMNTTATTGSGEDYMPPYYSVLAWRSTA